ncbi:hypothetical protein SAMN05428996_2037 [Quadrisphaera sp. DSM 44207]|nr:hypothetical protein SAMN05428996_2037 [Quadrisphaera sp. DSM 44207]
MAPPIPAYAESTRRGPGTWSATAAHPRVRGEHLAAGLGEPAGGRLIPAYAGSTSTSPTRPCPRPAHPRVRGEHATAEGTRTMTQGSSPRTRGARSADKSAQIARRLIPAYAGSTPGGRRGGLRRRLIPAYAGSTRRTARRWARAWAHPRVRGEHDAGPAPAVPVRGSSPRTRGALRAVQPQPDRQGLIPAYAGSTTRPGAPTSKGRAHPRVRGEHTWDRPSATAPRGSSPRTRGARSRWPARLTCIGLIPAYAGSTSWTWAPPPSCAAHPRVRGEHSRAGVTDATPAGSSPRTRGARDRRRGRRADLGLIPAYAGSTG